MVRAPVDDRRVVCILQDLYGEETEHFMLRARLLREHARYASIYCHEDVNERRSACAMSVVDVDRRRVIVPPNEHGIRS